MFVYTTHAHFTIGARLVREESIVWCWYLCVAPHTLARSFNDKIDFAQGLSPMPVMLISATIEPNYRPVGKDGCCVPNCLCKQSSIWLSFYRVHKTEGRSVGQDAMFTRIEQQFGPAIMRLPWESPSRALAILPTRYRKEVTCFAKWLDKSWHEEGAVGALASAMTSVMQESRIFALPGAVYTTPGWVLDTQDVGRIRSFEDIRLDEKSTNPMRSLFSRLVRLRCYDANPNGALTNRPANNAAIVAEFGLKRLLTGIDEFLEPMNTVHQLRTIIYSKRLGPLYFGAFRPTKAQAFSEIDHARLYALQGQLIKWWRVASVIGLEPIVESGLTQSLQHLSDVALLLHKGKVVHANPVARKRLGDYKKWLRAIKLEQIQTFPLQLPDARIELALIPIDRTPASVSERANSLPAYLLPILTGLERGLTDKEIAQAQNLTTETVRTYVKRVFESFGVHDRRALIRKGDLCCTDGWPRCFERRHTCFTDLHKSLVPRS